MTVGTIVCDGVEHTLRYDGELVLMDHDLERDLAFQALRAEPPEGCLGVREAWQGIQRPEASHDFLEAMLVDDEDIRARMIKDLRGRLAFAPQLSAALEQAGSGLTPFEQRCRWMLALVELPHPLRVAYCRSLWPDPPGLDDHQLRVALIGEERMAEVVPFMRPAKRSVKPPKH